MKPLLSLEYPSYWANGLNITSVFRIYSYYNIITKQITISYDPMFIGYEDLTDEEYEQESLRQNPLQFWEGIL